MKVGVTGHQERDGIDWAWVRSALERALASKGQLIGYSSLAAGADQVFAKVILDKGGVLKAVIPIPDYAEYFHGTAKDEYNRLLQMSTAILLNSSRTDEQAFLDAGKWIVRKVDLLVAIWDGEAAEGAGGTGDIVEYAVSLGKPVLHIDPISRKIATR